MRHHPLFLFPVQQRPTHEGQIEDNPTRLSHGPRVQERSSHGGCPTPKALAANPGLSLHRHQPDSNHSNSLLSCAYIRLLPGPHCFLSVVGPSRGRAPFFFSLSFSVSLIRPFCYFSGIRRDPEPRNPYRVGLSPPPCQSHSYFVRRFSIAFCGIKQAFDLRCRPVKHRIGGFELSEKSHQLFSLSLINLSVSAIFVTAHCARPYRLRGVPEIQPCWLPNLLRI